MKPNFIKTVTTGSLVCHDTQFGGHTAGNQVWNYVGCLDDEHKLTTQRTAAYLHISFDTMYFYWRKESNVAKFEYNTRGN
jgi:hypothetical protein